MPKASKTNPFSDFVWRLFVCSVCFLFLKSAAAQSDDITRLGQITPLYILSNRFQEDITTASDEILRVTISDIAVESDQIQVRFYMTDLNESWRGKINNVQRLYGSYLPIAEIILNDGDILTPSSASTYSLLEYNDRLIIGGKLVFFTDKTPQTFYLNFNQIPFDTVPLKEGFSHIVVLTTAKQTDIEGINRPVSKINGIEFTLDATAQTTDLTMLQPCVSLERQDEMLSKFGWITISNSLIGKRYASERGTLYGFNLTDDNRYYPAHAYVFAPLTTETPINISMDYVYVTRSFTGKNEFTIDLQSLDPQTFFLSDDFSISISSIQKLSSQNKIRLYLSSDKFKISDIFFSFPDLNNPTTPSVSCGIDPNRIEFACDVFLDEFPENTLKVKINAAEYRKAGPWILNWTPAAMTDKQKTIGTEQYEPEPFFSHVSDFRSKEQPAEIQAVIDQLEELNRTMTETEGWIRESFQMEYTTGQTWQQDLIQADMFDHYLTNYISENWYFINEEANIHAILEIIRDSSSGKLVSAMIKEKGKNLDLLHGLTSQLTASITYDYQCFKDFTDIINSSAEFLSREKCGEGLECLSFHQSMTGLPNSRENQSIVFQIDPDTGFIIQEIINYNSGELVLNKTTLEIKKYDALPEDLQLLLDSVL